MTAPSCTVVGEALVDLVQDPDRPGGFTAHAGGSPYNVALTLARLGTPVQLVARRGPDEFGAQLEASARPAGVGLDHWTVAGEPTSLAVATVDATGQARYGFYLDHTAALGWREDDPALAAVGTAAGVLHLGSLAGWREPSATAVQAMQRRAHARGDVLVSYDPNVRPALVDDPDATRARIEASIAAAHVVKASDEDVALLHPGVALEDVARRWCASGTRLVVVTRGGEGAVAFGARGEHVVEPGRAVVVADTVGAGDSFAGALLSALVRDGVWTPAALDAAVADASRLQAALREAVTVSAMTCERPGADPPTRDALEARLAAPR